MEHQLEHTTQAGKAHGLCTCGRWVPTPSQHEWQIEDQFLKHVETVQRARAALSRRNVSLENSYKWYRQQEENEQNTPNDRRQWKVLADELEPRLKFTEDADQLPLF